MEDQQCDQYQSLFGVPKPRRVRIKTFTRITLIAFPAVAIILLYSCATQIVTLGQARIQSLPIFGTVFGAIFALILLAASGVNFWIVRRDKKLMRDGELAVGVVTHHKLVEVRGRRGGRRTRSRVRYRFKDASGQLYQGTGTDDSRRLRVDMTVPVFYNPNDPETNVTICTSSCELKGAND